MYPYTGMSRRPQRTLGGCITGLVILLLIFGGLIFLVSRAHSGVTITVGDHPTLIADNCNGSVLVQRGPDHQITLAGIFPQYTQDSTTNTIEITQCDTGSTVTVPAETNLQIDANDSITVLGVSGTMKLGTNGSRLTMEGVTLEGQSKIDVNGGAIVFVGSLAQGSAPTISDNSGSIDMTLPASASFHLNVTGILGPISSNVPGVRNPADETGEMHLDVGSNSSASQLTLELNDTAVILDKSAA